MTTCSYNLCCSPYPTWSDTAQPPGSCRGCFSQGRTLCAHFTQGLACLRPCPRSRVAHHTLRDASFEPESGEVPGSRVTAWLGGGVADQGSPAKASGPRPSAPARGRSQGVDKLLGNPKSKVSPTGLELVGKHWHPRPEACQMPRGHHSAASSLLTSAPTPSLAFA